MTHDHEIHTVWLSSPYHADEDKKIRRFIIIFVPPSPSRSSPSSTQQNANAREQHPFLFFARHVLFVIPSSWPRFL